MNLKVFIAALTLTTSVSCAPIKVSSGQTKDIDFSKLNTYSWGKNSLTVEQVNSSVAEIIQNVENMVRRDIQRLTDDELSEKGYRLTDNGKPDFVVRYIARGKSDSPERTDYGASESIYLKYNAVNLQFLIGYLTIEIIDPETNQILWAGSAEAVVTGDGTSNRRLNRTIKKILNKLPQK